MGTGRWDDNPDDDMDRSPFPVAISFFFFPVLFSFQVTNTAKTMSSVDMQKHTVQ